MRVLLRINATHAKHCISYDCKNNMLSISTLPRNRSLIFSVEEVGYVINCRISCNSKLLGKKLEPSDLLLSGF